MTEEEFGKLPLAGKWAHIQSVMEYISSMDQAYTIRRRLNPHHPTDDIATENRNMRVDQYQRWAHIKSLYAVYRDEMINTMGHPKYAECKNVLERIFTMELDDALRDAIDEN